MDNEQENATQENAEESFDLDLGTEEEEKSEPKPKKEFSTEEKLARVERMRTKYLKELGLDKPEPKSESKAKPDDRLEEKLEKMALKSEGITHPEDIELARNTAKKWNVDIDEVLADEDFKVKLERQQTNRSNTLATSGVRGGSSTSQAKNTPEYWLAKGQPPTPAEVPDADTRRKIARSFMSKAKGNGKMSFYNS
jgi:hypothetical protein